MAAVDKIYCSSRKDFIEFYEWCEMFEDDCYKATQKNLTDYFYIIPSGWPEDDKNVKARPITNTPTVIDKWLNVHCPLKIVRDAIIDWGYDPVPPKKQFFLIEKSFDRESYRQDKTIKAIRNYITELETYKDSEYMSIFFDPEIIKLAKKALNGILKGKSRYLYLKLNNYARVIY